MSPRSNPRGQTVIVTSIIFMALATIFVFIRLFTRFVIVKSAGIDDLAILLSFICSIVLFVLTDEQAKHGLGKHYTEVSPTDFEDMLMYLWILISFYNVSLCLTKASIVLQYQRIFGVGTGFQRACWVTLTFIGAYGIATVVSNIFTCMPVSGFWSPTPKTHCVVKKTLWFSHASINILSDLIILILPMPVIKSLKLPMRQKVGLLMIFALGGFVCLVSVLRLQSLYIISISTDPTFDNAGAALWTNVEVYTGIICASLPTIKPLISRLSPGLLSTTRSGNSTDNLSSYGFGNQHAIKGPAIRLTDVNKSQKTVTKVEASKRRGQQSRGDSISHDFGKDIFVVTSMRQDVDRKSETGSERDFIVRDS